MTVALHRTTGAGRNDNHSHRAGVYRLKQTACKAVEQHKTTPSDDIHMVHGVDVQYAVFFLARGLALALECS